MIYSNDDPAALMAMEQDRTGNYGNDYYDECDNPECPVCREYSPDYYYMNEYNECVGCSECIHKEYTII